jgi:hypothetical protein
MPRHEGRSALSGGSRAAVPRRRSWREAAPWVTNTVAPIGLGTGGILAIDMAGALTLNTGVAASVDGQGFRGGAGPATGGG